METYNRYNNIVGWIVFALALIVYSLTMESSASFWDCGEFISGAYKLEVVHPPGAPFFLMLGRIFTLFTFGNPEFVALSINFLSALSTAFAVLFCFWSFTMLAKMMIFRDGNYSSDRIIAVLGSGFIAAATCTFLDSLWFSASEGEVYAMSIGFMAFVLWAILRYEAADHEHDEKWLMTIALAIGISTGVHLLSLLVLPVAGAVYYFKHYKATITGFLISQAVSLAVIGFIMKIIIPGIPSLAAKFDLLFVNSLNLPFNSGALTFVIFFIAALIAAIFYTHRSKHPQINKILLAFSFILIGYSTIIMVPIRSQAHPPINMNKPNDPFKILSYLNREQYGDRPLMKGPSYVASQYDLKDIKQTSKRWYKGDEKYAVGGNKVKYVWDESVEMIFPRMGFWQEDRHRNAYRGILKPDYLIIDRAANNKVVKKFDNDQGGQARQFVNNSNKETPNRYAIRDDISFGDNLKFFFNYQIGYMYMRYFMWNFAGKQNDIQGMYSNDDGGWISGITPLDNALTIWGNPVFHQDNLPASKQNNKATNKFYMLPFLLGIIGLVYHYSKDKLNFSVVFLLFFVTGILQIIYHNQPPIEPRERDYVLAGSFYAYAMWIGFGALAIYEFLRKRMDGRMSAFAAIGVSLVVPAIMGFQGWDDHDRSGRYTARDFAVNYLESCAPNAIIFTQGDNDTYPLWYAQEVEGIRPDIRTINLSLLGVDWYIDHLRYAMNDAPPVNLTFSSKQIRANNRDVTRFRVNKNIPQDQYYDLQTIMKFIASDDQKNKVTINRELENYLPTKKFSLKVNRDKVRELNMVSPERESEVLDEMLWTINSSNLLKNDLITLDIVANNINDRPIYFAVSVSPSAYMGLDKFFQLEGLAYRIVPIENKRNGLQNVRVRTDVMYENMMEKFRWGGIDDMSKEIYLDENIRRMTMNMRGNFARLAQALVTENKKQQGIEVLDRCLEVIPKERVPYNIFNVNVPEIYYQCDNKEKARDFANELVAVAQSDLDYMVGLPAGSVNPNDEQLQRSLFMIQEMGRVAKVYDSPEVAKPFEDLLVSYQSQLAGSFN